MEKCKRIIEQMSLDDMKELLFYLIKEIFSLLDSEAQKDLILEMIGQSDNEKVTSMVHL